MWAPMAALPQAPRSLPPQSSDSNRSTQPSLSSRRPLPHGACRYLDLSLGHLAPTCGCQQFWEQSDVPRAAAGNTVRSNTDNTEWCVCEHHACFHEFAEPHGARRAVRSKESPPGEPGPGRALDESAPVYIQLDSRGDGRFQLLAGSQPVSIRTVARNTQKGPERRQCQGEQRPERAATTGPVASAYSDRERQTSTTRAIVPYTGGWDPPSQLSSSGLPRIPSICLLRSDEIGQVDSTSCQNNGTALPDTMEVGCDGGAGGLGLTFQANNDVSVMFHNSPTVVAEDFFEPPEVHINESQRLHAQQGEAGDDCRHVGHSQPSGRDILDRRSTIPPSDLHHVFNIEDLLQSATEIATPSVANTPDLRNIDHAIHSVKQVAEVLSCAVAPNKEGVPASQEQGHLTDSSAKGNAELPQLGVSDPSRSSPDSQRRVIKSLTSTLQNLIPCLASIRYQLDSCPNLSQSLRSLSDRLDALENASFSYMPIDELGEKLELFDGRLVDAETRLEEHEKFHASLEADQSSQSRSHHRRLLLTEEASFVSISSVRSSQSGHSALVSAAQNENTARLDCLEQRLADLEASATPSYANPWEVEVVFLPWGRDLKGIWYPSNTTAHPSSGITQDSEDWTQPCSQRSTSRTSISLASGLGSGWTEQAIHDWADHTHEWLSPRACNMNSTVYKRLRSRGFVRRVTLYKSGSKAVQATIVSSFEGLVNLMTNSAGNEETEDPQISEVDGEVFLGLKAPLIPLRKIHKSSRLRFLDRAEMTSSALWNADFLASDVIMRAAGGQKRLFVTQRHGYLQRPEPPGRAWTWQRIRELPRIDPNKQNDSEASGNHVAEADAKEACWMYHQNLDPPLSVQSSFGSEPSMQSAPSQRSVPFSDPLSIRPAREHPRSSQPASTVLIVPKQPITPLSEFPASRTPRHPRARTLSGQSMPLADDAALDDASISTGAFATAPEDQQQHSKRRIASFEYSGPPSAALELSALAPSSKPKRRRLTRTPERSVDAGVGGAYNLAQASRPWNGRFTPRRSREPPSPSMWHMMDDRELNHNGSFRCRRSRSRSRSTDLVAMQRSASGVGKGGGGMTPFAYATPATLHSGTVLGRWCGSHSDEESVSGGGDGDGDGEGEWEGVQDEDDEACPHIDGADESSGGDGSSGENADGDEDELGFFEDVTETE